MLDIITLRHGITDWNRQKRIQGHTDIPLAAEGVSLLQQYSLPSQWHDYHWLCSPLIRTRQTAETLGLKYQVEPALIEMHWGEWEGQIIADLRRTIPGFDALEARGLDLQPTGGESPRQVQQRITRWVQHYCASVGCPITDGIDGIKPVELDTPLGGSHQANRSISSQTRTTIGIVTHKGVIRAMLAAATGWDMLGKPPVKLNYQAAQCFSWDPQLKRWQLSASNIPLLPE